MGDAQVADPPGICQPFRLKHGAGLAVKTTTATLSYKE